MSGRERIMNIIYSIGVRFGGGGIGNTSLNAVRGIYRHGYLRGLIVATDEKGEFEKGLVKTIRLPRILNKMLFLTGFDDVSRSLLVDRLFDKMAVQYIDKCNIFHGWNNFSLASLRRAKSLGAITVIERASSHPNTQNNLLEEEYNHFLGKSYINNKVKRLTERAIQELLECSYITVPSVFAANSMIKNGIEREKLLLIPFGVDICKFKPAEKKDNIYRVLFVGQVSIRKGILYLLEAWKELNLSNSELTIAGEVSPDIKQFLKKYVNNPAIKFYGHVSNPVKIFQSASTFIFPSIEEGSALVTYEAMACGLPVIVTENSGSVARDGIDGFIIPIRNVEAIKEKILTLCENHEKRTEMGISARKHIEQFTWDRYGTDLVSTYKRITSTE